MRQVVKNGPIKICRRQPLKKLKKYGLLTYPFKFSKGSLPQILLGPFLNTLSQMLKVAIIKFNLFTFN